MINSAKCETGWGDLSTRAPFETMDCHPTPPLISFAATLLSQGRVSRQLAILSETRFCYDHDG
jgi:hypothetical protein